MNNEYKSIIYISLCIYSISKDPTTNVFERKKIKDNQIFKDNIYNSFVWFSETSFLAR